MNNKKRPSLDITAVFLAKAGLGLNGFHKCFYGTLDRKNNDDGNSRKALLATAEKLRKTLYSFGVSAKVENVSVGPAITGMLRASAIA